jgi:hypothetical protein
MRPPPLVRTMDAVVTLSPLASRIEHTLTEDVDRPWCVHRLYEEVVAAPGPGGRESMLELTQRAADELVAVGRARREYVSAIGIGVHCEDALYWAPNCQQSCLADFGPEYESPTILHRMASHFQCRGL